MTSTIKSWILRYGALFIFSAPAYGQMGGDEQLEGFGLTPGEIERLEEGEVVGAAFHQQAVAGAQRVARAGEPDALVAAADGQGVQQPAAQVGQHRWSSRPRAAQPGRLSSSRPTRNARFWRIRSSR